MRVIVDLERCVGHARCQAVAGAVYSTDPTEGKAVPITGEIPTEAEALALRGAKSCPERAITVMGGPGDCDQLWPPRPRVG